MQYVHKILYERISTESLYVANFIRIYAIRMHIFLEYQLIFKLQIQFLPLSRVNLLNILYILQ